MIKFDRYAHVNDLIKHYIVELGREDVNTLVEHDIKSAEEAATFCRFIWSMVEKINEDEENRISVLGSTDNTEMLPDISYEVTKLMKDAGHYSVWEQISNEEM